MQHPLERFGGPTISDAKSGTYAKALNMTLMMGSNAPRLSARLLEGMVTGNLIIGIGIMS